MPSVTDADVIGAFLSGTTCESLLHKEGRKSPRTTKELLDTAMNHASGEEVIGAIFDRTKGKGKWDESAGEGASNRPGKKNKRNNRGSLVAVTDRKAGKAATGEAVDHFEKMLEKPCQNHTNPVNTCTKTAPS